MFPFKLVNKHSWTIMNGNLQSYSYIAMEIWKID